MKQFYDAQKEFQPVEKGGTFLSRDEEQKYFFKAGMLAAADMVTDSARGMRLSREDVANKIRKAAE